ncbi:MAG TPA: L-threonylcarbamoyladenylate synthase [Fimbriimonadaceae bacterium]|nr:L-threonylcarbamoyladenylate synthase [Fimbriimonadaceae bacterium]
MIPSHPSPQNIQRAAEILLDGDLVVMPTETVYGIAADATNAEAVRRIFEAKQRPTDNPLIIHISDFIQLEDVVGEWNDTADILANRFWPGPLTLILKKSEMIPLEATAGLDTVAVRMPAHPVALELIEVAGIPVAAPSANRFMHLSPTRAEHVAPEIAEKIEMILDGGPCVVGLESTVIDVTTESPRILRPGGVSRGEIQAALGRPLGQLPPGPLRRAPGMYARHYAPRAQLRIVEVVSPNAAALVMGEPASERQIKMPGDPRAYASVLYESLHKLDSFNPEAIEVQCPPDEPDWEAVLDRLRKAAVAQESSSGS